MTNITTENTRENWLNEAATLLFTFTLNKVASHNNITLHPYKISVGQCGAQKVIGQCWPRSRSEDGINEVFIAPHISDSSIILATLTHELIHALDDCQHGHKGTFAKMARQADLQGKLTSTHAGETLQETINDIIDALGDIPHSKLDTAPIKKQTTRMLLVECQDCGWRFRATKKHVEAMTALTCLCCGNQSLELEVK